MSERDDMRRAGQGLAALGDAVAIGRDVAHAAEAGTSDAGAIAGAGHATAGVAHAVDHVLGAVGVDDERARALLGVIATGAGIVAGVADEANRSRGRAAGGAGHAAAEARSERTVRGVEELTRDAHEGHDVTFELVVGDRDPSELVPAAFELDERIGRPYSLRVTALARAPGIPVARREGLEASHTDPDGVVVFEDPIVIGLRGPDLLGEDATFTIKRGSYERPIRGIVDRVEETGATPAHRVVVLTIVPAVAALAMERDSRIFTDMRPEEVLEFVLGASLPPYGREARFPASVARPAREYCVQYRETNLDFVHRILEEEGLTYYFAHDEAREVLCVAEGATDFPEVELDVAGPVEVRAGDSRASLVECLFQLRTVDRATATSVAVQDFDWSKAPNQPILVESDREVGDGFARRRHLYEHERALNLGTFPCGSGADDAAEQMLYRIELAQRDALTVAGAGCVTGFAAGHIAHLRDLAVGGSIDETFLLTRVTHRGADPRCATELALPEPRPPRYENAFEAIPTRTPYRPDRVTPKPRIAGVQTAIVVTSNDEVLHSDEHRRVRVRFHWDRFRPEQPERSVGDGDAASQTARVRVAQAWAGPGYGAVFVPRRGMEVVVAFLDGDPDRPLIVGCAYNAAEPPPYTSERDWTVSGIRTETVDGAHTLPGHYNELRFDDQKGHELVHIRAQKDLDEVVLHDHTAHVGHDRTEYVDRHYRLSVGGDQTDEVEGSRSVFVGGGDDLEVLGDRKLRIAGEERRRVEKSAHAHYEKKRAIQVDDDDHLHVRGKKETRVDTVCAFSCGERFEAASGDITLHSAQAELHVGLDAAELHASAGVQLRVGQARVKLTTDGVELAFGTQTKIRLTSAGISIETPGETIVRGNPVRLN